MTSGTPGVSLIPVHGQANMRSTNQSKWARRFLLATVATAAICHTTRAQDAVNETPEQLIAAIEAEQAKLPRTHMSIAAVIAELGNDATPASIHAWVKKNVRAVDYAGSLRDVEGVLADRTGNSLDRSLLLARLLSQSGYDVKIVGADTPSQVLPVEAKEATAREVDTDEGQASRVAEELVKLVNPAKPTYAAANRHWWVQYDEGNNKWADLDPALEPGKQAAAPTGKPLEPDARTGNIIVPDELRHRVTLTLEVERWEDGKLLEAPALQMSLDNPKDAGLLSNRITFQPFNAKLGRVFARDDATSPKLRASLMSETAWCPVIVDATTSGKLARMFDDAGIVGDVPKGMSGPEEISRAIGSGIGGLMGGMTGGDAPAAEKPTVLTAVFADYLILIPGEKPKLVRRPIFDTLGPAQREAAAKGKIDRPKWTDDQRLARGVELGAIHSTLVARAAVDFDEYTSRYAQRVIDAKPLIIESLKGPLDEAKASRVADLTSFNSLELFASQRSTASDATLYVAEPQVYRRIVALVPSEKDQLTLRATSDLAWNPLRTTGDSSKLIEAGVLDTLRESAVIMAKAETPDQSTAVLVDAAKKSGASLKLVTSADDLAGIELPADAAARVRSDLTNGHWVVIPTATVAVNDQPRTGWWRIDPATLQTVGAMDTGYLQNTIEYTETHEVNGIMITKFGRMKVSDAAHVWAREVIKRRGNTSWNQWINLLKLAQKTLNSTGGLPPL